ncbi:uncharacterized protein LOC103928117 isoform X2 [Pyrus x bretschneideri]|uniref:uncharacterized protein LOC103928117 isoform X2 n=1 Tax=Pyrus x bretschneideri TaxID=225117 RepID=UPI00202E4D89|nr:uncharacterized protein LOC103928117 isoform X2 [Pyrus x bretschneideri]XP_048426723.1 uncharacterized protein LOC103928117 isoform X2 [Pyrus x bretschneideri]
MASAQKQSANVDLFDAYFGRADLDRDGRISGNEAVAFFQGSGLPKQVLAQDNDSMLSVREFCVAVYLMERLGMPSSSSATKCDNRLTEITERASADKYEAESLAKKYEEKYKQAGDVASKLTIEEATFRDLPVAYTTYKLQEKKMELNRAVVKMEQEGDSDAHFRIVLITSI